MIRIGHIVNPFKTNPKSELHIAQPITLESMKVAKSNACSSLKVNLFASQYKEDLEIVPDYFIKTKNLDRSAMDINPEVPRRLPLIRDILDRVYESSNDDYLIYTNIDIALMPNFYNDVLSCINKGYEAFSITRRTIPKTYSNPSELPLMYLEKGEPHSGWDCFVFKRDLYKNFILGNVYIGYGFIGMVLFCNCLYTSQKSKTFYDMHSTFHLGDDAEGIQFDANSKPYIYFNKKNSAKVLKEILNNTQGENYNQIKKYYDYARLNLKLM